MFLRSNKDGLYSSTVFSDTLYAQHKKQVKLFEEDNVNSNMEQLYYEICNAIASDENLIDKAIGWLLKLELKSNTKLQELLVDALCIVWQKYDVNNSDNNEKDDEKKFNDQQKSIIKFVRGLKDKEIIPQNILKQSLSLDLLGATDFLIKNISNWKRAELKHRTNMFFRQEKFNLLREESEGFAKIIALFYQYFVDQSYENDFHDLIDHVTSIIGYFSVDPNRVADIALDIYELHIEQIQNLNENCIEYKNWSDFVQLLRSICNLENITPLLGFKFAHYNRPQIKRYTPKSLFYLAAKLITDNICTLEQVYTYIYPTDEQMALEYEARTSVLLKKARKTGVVNLNADSEEIEAKLAAEKKEEEEILNNRRKYANIANVCNLGIDKPNQKIELLSALLSLNNWTASLILLKHLQPLQPLENEGVCNALCKRINSIIEPLYDKEGKTFRRFCQKKPEIFIIENNNLTLKNVADVLYDYLQYVGAFLYRDIILLTKICRLLLWHIKDAKKENDNELYILDLNGKLALIVSNILLPSFSMCSQNFGLSTELWYMLSELRYEDRYALYAYWDEQVYELNSLLTIQKAQVLKSAKAILKRVAGAEDVMKLQAVELLQVGSCNPTIVYKAVLQQVQIIKGNGFIDALVESMIAVPDLNRDVILWLLLREFGTTRSKMKDDGMNLASWFTQLSYFVGTFLHRYTQTDFKCLVQYIINSLKDEKSLELQILSDLIHQMSRVEIFENISERELYRQAGGEALLNITRPKLTSKFKKSTKVLIRTLNNNNFILPLYALISQQKKHIIYKNESPHVRVISEMLDRAQNVLLQFVEFINRNIDEKSILIDIFPSLVELVEDYQVSLEDAMIVLRPIILERKTCQPKLNQLAQINDMNEDELDSMDTSELLCMSMQQIIKDDTWEILSPEFVCTFWSLAPNDIHLSKAYEDVPTELSTKLKSIENQLADLTRDISRINNDTDRKHLRNQISNLEKEKAIILQDQEIIKTESKTNKEAILLCRNNLKTTNSQWFQTTDMKKIMIKFFQKCFLPRCFSSDVDAFYCIVFIETMHKLKVKGFSTILFFRHLVGSFSSTLKSCSVNEANRYGIVLEHALLLLDRWRTIGGRSMFRKEIPGFKCIESDEYYDWSDFNCLIYQLFTSLRNSIIECLKSNDATIRNALVVLNRFQNESFPVVKCLGKSILNVVADILKNQENGSSLHTLSTRIKAKYTKQESNWVIWQEFLSDYKQFPDNVNEDKKKLKQKKSEITVTVRKSPSPVSSNEITVSRKPPSPPSNEIIVTRKKTQDSVKEDKKQTVKAGKKRKRKPSKTNGKKSNDNNDNNNNNNNDNNDNNDKNDKNDNNNNDDDTDIIERSRSKRRRQNSLDEKKNNDSFKRRKTNAYNNDRDQREEELRNQLRKKTYTSKDDGSRNRGGYQRHGFIKSNNRDNDYRPSHYQNSGKHNRNNNDSRQSYQNNNDSRQSYQNKKPRNNRGRRFPRGR